MTHDFQAVTPLSTTSPLTEQLDAVASGCSRCQVCVAECAFLQKYGDPGKIAETHRAETKSDEEISFECSLCGLCTAVCPDGVDPVPMFLEMRRDAVARGEGDFPEHAGLKAYERKGTSRRYSWYALPDGCDTVFFPGCSLPGSRPEQTLRTFGEIRHTIPQAGIVLDCCTKPSHDFGRQGYFDAMFGEMKAFLLRHGVHQVLVACPNCHLVFSRYAPEFTTRTVYEVLAASELPATGAVHATIQIHDPCVARFAPAPQDAVRRLAAARGLNVVEAKHSGRTTLCCGEGGAVGALAPELARNWTHKRIAEADGTRTVTYCSGCARMLGAHTPASHILDIVFEPQAAMEGRSTVAKAPFTYLNRLRLKRRLQRELHAAVTRERTFTAEPVTGVSLRKPAFLVLVAALVVAVRMTGLTEHLDQEKLRTLVEGYGPLAPLLYMALYAVAPALLLPGLPITVVGGILFGPLWGVVYTITAATAGACVAFFVSRYLARDWVASKLRSPRWRHLDEEVEKHGWKMVAFTRLIPLFPFNLLNYAFGLTRVKFSHYAVATFFCMLPGCIAYIVFSSSLLDVLRGRISPTFLVGVVLVVLVSLIPVLYRRCFARRS